MNPPTTHRSKRRIFVASSKEHHKIALGIENYINDMYSDQFDCEAWINVGGKVGGNLIERLRTWVREYHLGIFVFAPDDLLQQPHPEYGGEKSGESSVNHIATRDNVIFELGGWIAFAGTHRAYALIPSNPPVKMPTDMDGVIPRRYNYDKTITSKRLSDIGRQLGPALNDVFDSIKAKDNEDNDNFFRESIQELETRITKEIQHNPLEAVRHLCSSLRNTLTDKVIALQDPYKIDNYLKDLLLWVRTSLDALDHKQLAESQGSKVKKVWVFAPRPLEATTHADAKDLLETVATNIKKKVDYYYFVENDGQGVQRALKLAAKLKSTLSPLPKGFDQALRAHFKIVVLKPEYFSAYYTIQFGHGKKPATVFQSIVRDDRQDLLIKLDPLRAREIKDMVECLLNEAKKKKRMKNEFTVYSL